MEESYSIGLDGVKFHGWPDGGSLMEQEQCTVDILKIAVTELRKEYVNVA